ncbi:MAG TPA: hypothetical protein ENJ62_03940 [Bryobacterales bacterium]|nr:hypothetical protein [Bryobacterales bacterium]
MLGRIIVAGILAAGAPAAADPALVNLLAPDTKVAAGVDCEAVRASPLGAWMIERSERHGKELDEFAAETGFDPRRDLTEIVLGGNGLARDSEGVFAARGRFDRDALLAYAERKGVEVTSFGSVPAIVVHRKRPRAVAFPETDVLVAGKPEAVAAAAARWEAGAVLAGEIRHEIDRVSAGKHAWFVLLGSPAELLGKLPEAAEAPGPGTGRLLRAIEAVTASALFGPQIEMAGEIDTTGALAAQALAHVIEFFASVAQLGDSERADLMRRLLDDLDVTVVGDTVLWTLTMAESDLEELLEKMPRRRWGRHAHRAAPGSPERSGRPARSGRGR